MIDPTCDQAMTAPQSKRAGAPRLAGTRPRRSRAESRPPRGAVAAAVAGEVPPVKPAAAPRASMAYTALKDDLTAMGPEPFDALAVTALLESTGLRDADARDRFGAKDLFTLGESIFPSLPLPVDRQAERPAAHLSFLETVRRFAPRYGTGLAYMVPASAQILCFVLLGYSLWAWSGFTNSQATVVALATLFSLTLTAPFVQTIARRGAYYRQYQNGFLQRAEYRRLILLGEAVALPLGLVVGLLYEVTGNRDGIWFPLYCMLLSLFWLAIAGIDACRLRWLVSPTTFGGVLLVFLLHDVVGVQVVHAQWMGMAATTAFLHTVVAWRMQRSAKRTSLAKRRVPLLPLTVLLVRTAPILAYGLLYYAFLFTDRIIAWTTGPLPKGRMIIFRGGYEAGLDWALLVLLLSTSVLEYSIQGFAERLLPVARRTISDDDNGFVRAFLPLFCQGVILLIAVALASLLVALMLLVFTPMGANGAVFGQPEVRHVFLSASAGYLLFALGLYGAVYLQSLACQGSVVRCLLAGLATDSVVGLIAVHFLGFEGAVLGLICGAAVFAAGTLFLALRTLHRGSYHLAATLA